MFAYRHLRVGGGAVLLAAAIAACSSQSGGPPVASAASPASVGPNAPTQTVSQDPNQLWTSWASCIRQHGVAIADPVLDSQNQPQFDLSQAKGVPESVKRAAMQACQGLVKGAQQNTKQVDPAKALALAKCMRAHGVPNFPDPDPVTGNLQVPGTIANSPAFQTALNACRPAKEGY